MINLLSDKNFLLQLDKYPNKLIHARITALTLQEQPLQTIEGHITQGSVNVDGASAVRRTCSLTLVANYNHFSKDEAQKFFDYNWGLHTKFKLEIGVENSIDKNYPEIIWFSQGIYLITSINVSYSTNNFQLAIQGKDKMCLLNGEIGGILETSIDFGTEDYMGENIKIPIEKIILNAVHSFGKEPYHNIIINDLDTYGLELLEYRGNTPLYLLRKGDDGANDEFINLTYCGDIPCKTSIEDCTLETIETIGKGKYDIVGNILLNIDTNGSEVKFASSDEMYKIVRLQYGNIAGYRDTELTYNGELIANAGESLTSILDKIVKMLGQFEYFYDLDGRFVFQKKSYELSEIWGSGLNANKDENNIYVVPYTTSSDIMYSFSDSQLITAFTNAPNVANIKNDFSIWGERISAAGQNIPIHIRYAIDNKPVEYRSIYVEEENLEIEDYNNKYGTRKKGQKSILYISKQPNVEFSYDEETVVCDWREVIYRMATDYLKYNHLSDFLYRVAKANPLLYPSGITGYEQYYTDIQGFWRDLYFPKEFIDDEIEIIENEINELKDKRNKVLATYQKSNIDQKIKYYENKIEELKEKQDFYFIKDTHNFSTEVNGWSKSIVYTPELLNFWFDFLDLVNDAELEKYSVRAIGSRPKVVNDTTLHSIYYPDVPNIIYLDDIREKKSHFISTDYSYLQVPSQHNLLSVSAKGLSIKDKLNMLINEHTYYTESITLTTIPIYYLEPNTRIKVVDDATGINGEYLVSKITIPLQYNGTMQITATKAVENII